MFYDDYDEPVYYNDEYDGRFNVSKFEKIEELPCNMKWTKFINMFEGLMPSIRVGFNYESAIFFLEEAEKNGAKFYNTLEQKIIFMMRCKKEVGNKLFFKEGLDKKIDELSKIIDTPLFIKICDYFSDSLDVNILKEKRKENIHNLFLSKTGLTDLWFKDRKEYLYSDIYYYDNRDVSDEEAFFNSNLDLISYYYFNNIFSNVALDIYQILKYVSLTNNENIDNDRLNFYYDFYNIQFLSINDRATFLEKYKKLNYDEVLKNDMSLLRNDSHKKLVDGCTNFDKNSNIYQKALSNKYGCDIYYLDGEDFFGFVRTNMRVPKFDIKNGEIVSTEQPSEKQINRLSHSFTCIGTESIGLYDNPNRYLTLMYSNISPDKIVNIYHNDSWSGSGGYTSYVDELHTPQSLLSETEKYPEVNVGELDNIKPIGIVCMDEVTDWDLEFSKNNNLPIILINSQKYVTKDFDKRNNFLSENSYKTI